MLRNTDLTYKETTNCIVIEKKAIPAKTSNSSIGSGSVKGRVVESETSEPLPGASVVLVGGKLATSADVDGYYHFDKISSGEYMLEVSYMGFKKEQVKVQVVASKTSTYDVKLSSDATALDEITVSAVRKQRGSVPHMTEKLLTQEIKTLSVVASGISSEQISKSADRNAADVVKKIAGVSVREDKFIVVRGMNERYNLTYLNDNIAPSTELYSRAFALNLLPTRIIDKILVFKSPAPDMLADMAGGAVKIYTKDAVAVKHFDMEVNLGVRSNTFFKDNFLTYKGSSTDWLGFDNGLRKLPSVVPGYGNFTKTNISQKEYSEKFSNILAPSSKSVLPDLTFTANYYDAFNIGDNKLLTSLTSLSFKNENNSYEVDRLQSSFVPDRYRTYNIGDETQSSETAQLALLQNFTFKLSEKTKISFKNFLLQQGQKSTVYRTTANNRVYRTDDNGKGDWQGLWPNSSLVSERNIILGYTQRFFYTGNLTGDHIFGKEQRHKLNWNLGYLYSLQTIPDQRIIRLKNKIYGDYLAIPDYENSNWIAAVRGMDYGSENGAYDVTRGIISRTWTKNSENSYNGSLDYEFKVSDKLIFKTGTYHLWKERILFRRVYTVNEGDVPNSGYPSQAYIGATHNGYMDFNRILFRERDLGQVWSNYYLNDEGTALKVIDRTSGSDAYTATEQNNSGYMMARFMPNKDKIDISAGVRVEYDRQKVAGSIPDNVDGALNVPVLVDVKKWNWLPSVNLSYKPVSSWVFRMAYGQTLNRPEFRELSPYSELDYLNNQNISGNTNLVPSHITGYDARVEWYPGNDQGNSISVGAFFKDIEKPIERITSRMLVFNIPLEIGFDNAENAKVKGLEVDVRQSLNFIPVQILQKFSIIANYSLIHSEVKQLFKSVSTGEVEKEVKRQLQGQAPYMYNIGLYYDNPGSGTKASLIFNEIGPRLYAVAYGSSFKELNENNSGYTNAGYTGSIIELKRQQLDFAITQRIAKGLQAKLSVQNLLNDAIKMAEDENFTYKYEPATNNNANGGDGDLISNSYKTGRYYNLTLTYSF